MFKNNCDLEKAKADWVLESADEFQEELNWKGLNLRPAFIRFVWTLMNLQSVKKDWYEKKILSKNNFQDVFLDFEQLQKPWKIKLNSFPGLQYTKHKIQWMHYFLKKNNKNKPLIAVNDWKHTYYLKRSKLFNEFNPIWLVDTPYMAKQIGLDHDDLIIPHTKPFNPSNSKFPFNKLHDLVNGLKTSVMRSKPSAIFVVEGDAPFQSILAEIGRVLDIPVYCFQWGVFQHNKLRTAFSEMQFTKFLSWGPIFEDQLKHYNPHQNFISFGHLSSNKLARINNKIIFLGTYVNGAITNTDQELFFKLALSLAERFPDQVVWRPHPNLLQGNRKELENLKNSKVKLLNPKESLSYQLRDSVVAVAISSSSLIDALYFGVIPISFNTTCLKEFPFPLVKTKVGFEYRNFDQALEQITDLMNNQDKISGIQKQIAATHTSFFSNTELSQQKNYIRKICKNKL